MNLVNIWFDDCEPCITIPPSAGIRVYQVSEYLIVRYLLARDRYDQDDSDENEQSLCAARAAVYNFSGIDA